MATLAGIATVATEANSQTGFYPRNRIFVRSEFAQLRTAIVAQSQIRLPDENFLTEAQWNYILSFLPQESIPLVKALRGHDLSEVDSGLQKQWEQERANLAQLLQAYRVEVLRPDLLTTEQKRAGGIAGYSNSFVRDPWFTVGNSVIEGALRFPHRRLEVLASRSLMDSRVYPASCSYIAAPQPDAVPLPSPPSTTSIDNSPYIEGGDVLVVDRYVFVGLSGLASSKRGVDFLRKHLGPQGYIVQPIKLAPNVLHLDCALGFIRPGLIIVHAPALLEGLPPQLRGWERIDVTKDEAFELATNGLPISPYVYVTDPAFKHIGDRIARKGVKVEYLDLRVSRKLGGAFRCSTQALWRE